MKFNPHAAHTFNTVKELRYLIDQMEKNWSEEDVRMLGEFEEQLISTPQLTENGMCVGYTTDNVINTGPLATFNIQCAEPIKV